MVRSSLRGSIAPGHWQVKLLINARVHVQPDALRDAVEKALKDVAGDRVAVTITNVRNFFPSGPQLCWPQVTGLRL